MPYGICNRWKKRRKVKCGLTNQLKLQVTIIFYILLHRILLKITTSDNSLLLIYEQ